METIGVYEDAFSPDKKMLMRTFKRGKDKYVQIFVGEFEINLKSETVFKMECDLSEKFTIPEAMKLADPSSDNKELTQDELIKELNRQATLKLRFNKDTFSLIEQGSIQEIIDECQPESREEMFGKVVHQMFLNIRIGGLKKYECLQLWLDTETGGLAGFEPKLIIKIATEVGGLKV